MKIEQLKKDFVSYYEMKKNETDYLKKINSLEKLNIKLEKDLKTSQFTLEANITTARYDSVPSSSNGFTSGSYIEKQIDRVIGKMENNITNSVIQKQMYIKKLEKLKIDKINFETFLNTLDEHENELLRCKFIDNNTYEELSLKYYTYYPCYNSVYIKVRALTNKYEKFCSILELGVDYV